MTWFRCGGSGIPAALKNRMNAVFNKKFGTSGQNYPPKQWPDEVNLLGPLPEGTATGSIAHITDGADEVPIKSWEVTLPASLDGYSAIGCTKSGKNLLDTAISETKSNNSVSITCDGNGKYTATGTATGGSANITFTLKTPCTIKSGMYLHLMNSGASGSVSITLQKQDNTTIYAPALSPANRIADLSSYVGQTIYSIRFYIVNGSSFEMSLTPMLCFSNTATDYEPYTAPTQYTASLGRTIYGGQVDVVKGEGTEQYKKVKVSDLTWAKQTASGRDFFIANITQQENANTHDVVIDIAGLTYAGMVTVSAMSDKSLTKWLQSLRIYDTGISSVSDLLSAYGNGEIVFYLKDEEQTDFTFTPITPTPETALGVNNFWADEGDTTVVYRRDIDLALQAVSGSRGLMMATLRSAEPMNGEESDPDQVNELVENDEEVIPEQLSEVVENNEKEQEGDNNAR